MLAHLVQGRESRDQHGDDHPADGAARPARLTLSAYGLEQAGQQLPQTDTGQDAEQDPEGQVTLKEADGCVAWTLC